MLSYFPVTVVRLIFFPSPKEFHMFSQLQCCFNLNSRIICSAGRIICNFVVVVMCCQFKLKKKKKPKIINISDPQVWQFAEGLTFSLIYFWNIIYIKFQYFFKASRISLLRTNDLQDVLVNQYSVAYSVKRDSSSLLFHKKLIH